LENETQFSPAANWNKGIVASRGDYILLLCDDDVLELDCLREIDNYLIRHNHDVDVVRFLRKEFFFGQQDGIASFSCPGKEIESVAEYIYFQLKYFRGQALSDFVFSREAALQIKGFPEMPGCLASDKTFVVTLGALKNKIGNLNLPLLRYRWHGENYTTVRRPSLFVDSLLSDFEFYTTSNRILERLDVSPYINLARKENAQHWQIRQNTHFSEAMRIFGWRGLRQIYKATPDSSASRKKSFWTAIFNWIKLKWK
jgi:glycosyltransferase involved in cell wall biosynthesis